MSSGSRRRRGAGRGRLVPARPGRDCCGKARRPAPRRRPSRKSRWSSDDARCRVVRLWAVPRTRPRRQRRRSSIHPLDTRRPQALRRHHPRRAGPDQAGRPRSVGRQRDRVPARPLVANGPRHLDAAGGRHKATATPGCPATEPANRSGLRNTALLEHRRNEAGRHVLRRVVLRRPGPGSCEWRVHDDR